MDDSRQGHEVSREVVLRQTHWRLLYISRLRVSFTTTSRESQKSIAHPDLDLGATPRPALLYPACGDHETLVQHIQYSTAWMVVLRSFNRRGK